MARKTKQATNVATDQEKQDAAQLQGSDQHVQAEKMPAEQVVGERTRSRRTFRPPVDIYESEQGLMLLADVPGATPEGLHITLERHVLNVWARWRIMPRRVTARSTESMRSVISSAGSRSRGILTPRRSRQA